jgi:hypothetical protein
VADTVPNLTANPIKGPDATMLDTAFYPDNLHPNHLGYAYLAGAASGTYANANTYYASLQAVLRSTVLGAAMCRRQRKVMPILACQSAP